MAIKKPAYCHHTWELGDFCDACMWGHGEKTGKADERKRIHDKILRPLVEASGDLRFVGDLFAMAAGSMQKATNSDLDYYQNKIGNLIEALDVVKKELKQ